MLAETGDRRFRLGSLTPTPSEHVMLSTRSWMYCRNVDGNVPMRGLWVPALLRQRSVYHYTTQEMWSATSRRAILSKNMESCGT